MFRELLQFTSQIGKGIKVLFSDIIEFLVVDYHSKFLPILLWYKEDWGYVG